MTNAKNASKKTAAAKPATDVVRSSDTALVFLTARLEDAKTKFEAMLLVDTSTLNGIQMEQHKAERVRLANIILHNGKFATGLQDERYAAAWNEYALNAEAVVRLAIYAQEKLHATLKAIAVDCALSAIRMGSKQNLSTQYLLRALNKHKSLPMGQHAARMHDEGPSIGLSTHQSQSSTSRAVLHMLGLVGVDTMSNEWSLSDKGMELFDKLSA